MKKITLIIIALFFLTKLNAQFNEYYPEYEWLTIKGEHVQVHYHPEAERTARTVAKIADDVWGPITSLYEYDPGEVHFVIKDVNDFANGASYFFDNKIEIWASSLNSDLRGAHNWLRNVISHEFTHMVQIQASMKLNRSVPAIYLQFLNYEDKRRPDILYGFPNFIASYPIATVNVPAWFAEGTAQYMRTEFDYDRWDTHRDMILRSYALDGKMLTWNQMGVFNKTSLGNESVYNAGFALTRYIAQKYGEDKLRTISQQLGEFENFSIDGAIEDVLGISGQELYNEWSDYLVADYRERMKDVIANEKSGKVIADEGFGNFYPTFSEDGKRIAYVSNKEADYFGLSTLFVYDTETGKELPVMFNVRSTSSFVPGTNKIVYSKLTEDNENWINIHDLYVFDFDTWDETRLTHGLRADNPTVSPDGKKIAFVYQKDGTSNIGMVDINGENFRRITLYENGEQVFNPKFSPDGSFILFDYSYHHTRDIAKIDVSGANLEYVIQTNDDERNGVFGKDGKLYYSSDKTGIFNIYEYDMAAGESKRLTNVIGGAFMPAVNDNGDIAYAGYTSDGYKIFTLESDETEPVDDRQQYVWLENPPLNTVNPNGDINQFDIERLRNFNDYNLPDYEEEKYKGAFSRITFVPFIRYDNYNTNNSAFERIKPGVYVMSNDFLNRFGFFGGASINSRLERDMFLIFEYRDRLPLLYSMGLKPELSAEIYSISRKAESDLLFGVDSTFNPPRYDDKVPVDVTYSLFEFDLAAKQKVLFEGTDLEFRFIYSSYTATIGSFVIPNESNTLSPTQDNNYFIGRNFRVTFTHEGEIPNIDRDINPLGRKIELKYDYEFNKYNRENEFEVVDGLLKPIFEDYNFHRLELNWREHFEMVKGHTLTAHLRAGSILGPDVPDFFDFYLGGLLGMKAYPFYAVSGNEIGWFNLTYRFPLFRNIDTRIGHLYIDKIYMSVYGDIGNAWTGETPELDEFKKGAGSEIRIKMNSFYLFPTSIFFSAAYSFDKVERIVFDETVRYGEEWQFYGGVLFDFDFF